MCLVVIDFKKSKEFREVFKESESISERIRKDVSSVLTRLKSVC